ncbi:D-alanyl-D-alanine carboxypeptidase family protein [Actinomadura scrupuli]|uniref:D-alanyl-D-alanine carboxypeptidase family protein n=1 Tax=Actinomadura scrupuli TaxID=559629 RepID=UPI003D95585D
MLVGRGIVRMRRLGMVSVALALAVVAPATAAGAATTTRTPAVQPAARPAAQQVALASAPAGIAAKSAFVFDYTAGKTLWSRSPDARLPVGSITKTMTALLVIKAGHLDRKITISKKYVDYVKKHGASSAYLAVGDKVTVGQLLYAMMLPSGCDAAYALADSYGPGWSGFVKKMNAQAKTLGMKHTHYANFDGLPWPSATAGYSTARDQVTLARTAMKYTAFRTVVAKASYTVKKTAGGHSYTWKTTNRLLGSYPGMLGIKTGHTSAAGYCLLFAARRSSRTVIGVVLNSSKTSEKARFTDAAKALDWVYHTHTPVRLLPLSRVALD